MPGYVIHIAIAKRYIEKHPKEIKNKKEFIQGTIYPDTVDVKSKTHYGKLPSYTNLKKFLEDNDVSTDFEKGHFLHLISDYLFYNKYIKEIPKEGLYNDYDIINKSLIEKYNIQLPKEVTDTVFFIEGTPKVLNYELACKIIEEISSLNFTDVEKEIQEDKNHKWNTYSQRH